LAAPTNEYQIADAQLKGTKVLIAQRPSLNEEV